MSQYRDESWSPSMAFHDLRNALGMVGGFLSIGMHVASVGTAGHIHTILKAIEELRAVPIKPFPRRLGKYIASLDDVKEACYISNTGINWRKSYYVSKVVILIQWYIRDRFAHKKRRFDNLDTLASDIEEIAAMMHDDVDIDPTLLTDMQAAWRCHDASGKDCVEPELTAFRVLWEIHEYEAAYELMGAVPPPRAK